MTSYGSARMGPIPTAPPLSTSAIYPSFRATNSGIMGSINITEITSSPGNGIHYLI